MMEKEKLAKYLETINEPTFEGIIFGYIVKYDSDFTPSRLSNIINKLSKLIAFKAEENECSLINASQYAKYVKLYLEGKLYKSEKIARENVDVQIRNIDKVIDSCEGKDKDLQMELTMLHSLE